MSADGSAATRQRVTAALGRLALGRRLGGVAPAPQQEGGDPGMLGGKLQAAARRHRQPADLADHGGEPRGAPVRSPSSTAHRMSSSRRAATSTSRAGSSPCAASPGPYKSGRFKAPQHRTTAPPPSRQRPAPDMPAANPAAAAPSSSSPPAPTISCKAPSASPPPGKAASIAAAPNGSTPCRAGCSSRRIRSRSAVRVAARDISSERCCRPNVSYLFLYASVVNPPGFLR